MIFMVAYPWSGSSSTVSYNASQTEDFSCHPFSNNSSTYLLPVCTLSLLHHNEICIYLCELKMERA